MGRGDDDAAQHGLFLTGGDADLGHGIGDSKDKVEHIFQLAAEIVICYGDGIGFFLPLGQGDDVLHGQHLLGDDDEEQVRDLVGVIELFHRTGDQALLDVVADHGGGDLHTAQRGEKMVEIFGSLLQIQPHVRDILIAGHMESLDGSFHVDNTPRFPF